MSGCFALIAVSCVIHFAAALACYLLGILPEYWTAAFIVYSLGYFMFASRNNVLILNQFIAAYRALIRGDIVFAFKAVLGVILAVAYELVLVYILFSFFTWLVGLLF